MPLYCAGLCEAVNMAPGASSRPAAKYRRSVDARPRSTTSTPWAVTPSAKAAARSTPDSRMSRATRTRGAAAKRAKAAPTARHIEASNWSGTVPRMSYALKTRSSEGMSKGQPSGTPLREARRDLEAFLPVSRGRNASRSSPNSNRHRSHSDFRETQRMAMPVAVRSITFSDGTAVEIDGARVVVFVGPNNAGKTTALGDVYALMHEFDSDAGPRVVVRHVELDRISDVDEILEWLRANTFEVQLPYGTAGTPGFRRFGQPVQLTAVIEQWHRGLRAFIQLFAQFLGVGDRLGLAAGGVARHDPTSEKPTHVAQLLATDRVAEAKLDEALYTTFGLHLVMDASSNNVVAWVAPEKPVFDATSFTAAGFASDAYASQLRACAHIGEQGDGIRSFFGVLAPLLAFDWPVVFVDEPEAFLHPPQAKAVGRYLASS